MSKCISKKAREVLPLRTIDSKDIEEEVSNMCVEANCVLPCDIYERIKNIKDTDNETEKSTLEILIENADYARENNMPVCQDTGMAVFFVEVGQEVYVKGNLTDAINNGVRKGYEKGYLRKSVVADPLKRENTKDNTPAIIHYDLVPGDNLKITFCPKGFGSENKSSLKMLNPSDGREGIIDFVVDTVKKAGASPCPPIVIGIGIGGDFELCAKMAKKALTKPVDEVNPDPYYKELEEEILNKVNALNIGPQGFGGKNTALGVNILSYPTHIAGLPVAVNISCHVTRHITKKL